MPQSMRVLILNQHSGNFGDDAAGDALVDLLLASPAVGEIVIIYNGPDGSPRINERVSVPKGVRLKEIGVLNILLHFFAPRFGKFQPRSVALRNFRSSVSSADVVVVAPSGANIGIYRDWQFLLRLLMAIHDGATPVFHWNTLGKSGNPLFDGLARRVLQKSHLYVREQASRQFVESLGLTCEFGPDTAFALAPLELPVRQNTISLVPSELDSWHPEFRSSPVNDLLLTAYAHTISKFALSRGLNVDILPHLHSETERLFNQSMRDSLIREGLSPDSVKLRNDAVTYHQYDSLLASSRLVIGGRYHSVILTAKNCRPFVSLSYENKMKEVCDYLEMTHLHVDLHKGETSVDDLSNALVFAFDHEDQISSSLKTTVQTKLAPRIGFIVENIDRFTRP